MKTHKFSSRKDVLKLLRGTMEGIVLLLIAYLIMTSLFAEHHYKGYVSDAKSAGKDGFIAISYFGVDRLGSDTLIRTKQLDEQLRALKNSGYVTITQQDVLDYYNEGKAIPDKSLFLMFEDGNRDTAILAQGIMEKYNLKATMMTYAERIKENGSKYLTTEELINLVDSSFWELGTNGYRLSYINVFDTDQNYLGELTAPEFVSMSSKIDRAYNHYLMDYLRDAYGVPIESYDEMKGRIDEDYHEMMAVYTDQIGAMPAMYALKHANTGQFGTNDKTSELNKEHISNVFSMNFNRTGDSFNARDTSIYDLTRMEVKPSWSTNQLLMRISEGVGQHVKFVVGNEQKANKWEKIEGQAEFLEDGIVLTSIPEGRGLLRLKDQNAIKNFQLSVRLEGNEFGAQTIYVRADEKMEQYLSFQLKKNILLVNEKVDGRVKELYRFDVSEEKQQEDLHLEISTDEENITLTVDGTRVISDLVTTDLKAGSIYLEASMGGDESEQDHFVEDVYDGIFKELIVKDKDLDSKVIFDNTIQGLDAMTSGIHKEWQKVVNWFIRTL